MYVYYYRTCEKAVSGGGREALDAQVQKHGQDMRHDRQETNRFIVGLVRDIGRREGTVSRTHGVTPKFE